MVKERKREDGKGREKGRVVKGEKKGGVGRGRKREEEEGGKGEKRE